MDSGMTTLWQQFVCSSVNESFTLSMSIPSHSGGVSMDGGPDLRVIVGTQLHKNAFPPPP